MTTNWTLTTDATPSEQAPYLGAIREGPHRLCKVITVWWDEDHFYDESMGIRANPYAWAPWPDPPPYPKDESKMTNEEIIEWARTEKEKRNNPLFFPAVHSALNGAWDDVRKDLRRGRITQAEADRIADKFFEIGRIDEFQCTFYKGQFAEIAGVDMKKFVALTGRGNRIISVGADSEEEARKKVEEQLNREGRRDVYRQWVDEGRKVKEE